MKKFIIISSIILISAVVVAFLMGKGLLLTDIVYSQKQLSNPKVYKQVQMDTIYMQVASDMYRESQESNTYALAEGKKDGKEIRIEVQYYIDKDGLLHKIGKTDFNLLNVDKLYPNYISEIPTSAVQTNELEINKGYYQTKAVGNKSNGKISLKEAQLGVLYGVNPATATVSPLIYMTINGKLSCATLYANPTETKTNNPTGSIEDMLNKKDKR